MPRKLPERSTFLPSLSIRSIATIEPGSKHIKTKSINHQYNRTVEQQKKREDAPMSPPDKFAIPMHMFARLGGTPTLLNTVDEK